MSLTFVEWPTTVNTDFYAGTNGFKDNSVKTEFLSGRTIAYKANDKFLKTKSLSLRLVNTSANAEYKNFNTWLTETLGGVSGIFHCNALDEGSTSLYWRLTDLPEEDAGQQYKEIKLSIEQVYI